MKVREDFDAVVRDLSGLDLTGFQIDPQRPELTLSTLSMSPGVTLVDPSLTTKSCTLACGGQGCNCVCDSVCHVHEG
ncbi:hypothetical protein [Plantactinospora sp. WMMB782]|uniref:hypothetical protein n=1 Tax=Plantactinospora sp. WMMB782 TaxID=3404121 RepID=UPI003B9338AA